MYKLLVDNSGKDVCEDFSVNSTDGFKVDDFNVWPLLKTEIVSSGEKCNAHVDFVAKDFNSEKMVKFNIKKTYCETPSLKCRVKSFLRALESSKKMILGIENIDLFYLTKYLLKIKDCPHKWTV